MNTIFDRWRRQQQARQELLDLCEADPGVHAVMQAHGATRSTLENLYGRLIMAGAAQWASGHFVPASAITFPQTLEYLLTTHHATIDAAFRVVDYFERRETGPIND